ncbi:MAG: hypothetical protein ACLRFG_01740 [Clostridia bacterium]
MNTGKYYLVSVKQNPIDDPKHYVLTAPNFSHAFEMAKKRFPLDEHRSFKLQEISYRTYQDYRASQEENIR